MTALPEIHAVIPTFNGLPHILKSLESLRSENSSDYRLKIKVIDDGSSDGTSEQISKNFPEIEILTGRGDLWWTGAIEWGTREAVTAGADFVFWMNDDDQVSPGSIQKLLDFIKSHPQTIACSAVAMKEDQEEFLCGYRLRYWPWYLQPLVFLKKNFKSPSPLDLNGGHGILIPAELFRAEKKILRPSFFPHYVGDFDFFIQAQRAGYKAFTVPGAIIQNRASSSGLLSGRRIQSWKQCVPYLVSRRSMGNLRDRPLFALLNFPWGINLFWCFLFLMIPLGACAFYPLRRKS